LTIAVRPVAASASSSEPTWNSVCISPDSAGGECVGIGPVDAAGREFQGELGGAVAVLAHQQQPVVVVQSHDVHPVGIFDDVVGGDDDALRRDAFVFAQGDPAVAAHVGGAADGPFGVVQRQVSRTGGDSGSAAPVQRP